MQDIKYERGSGLFHMAGESLGKVVDHTHAPSHK